MSTSSTTSSQQQGEITPVQPLSAGMIVLIIFLVIIRIWAVYAAVKCNPHNRIGMGIVGLLFGEIYFVQHAFRKFILREPDYCSGYLSDVNPGEFDLSAAEKACRGDKQCVEDFRHENNYARATGASPIFSTRRGTKRIH
jgi:hypothetical protein